MKPPDAARRARDATPRRTLRPHESIRYAMLVERAEAALRHFRQGVIVIASFTQADEAYA